MKQWKTKQNKEACSFLSRYPLLTFLSLNICCSTDKFYIFYCYTGLAYVDAKNLIYDNIKEGVDGNLWIITKREKTDAPVTVPLMNTPLEIIEKYRNKQPDRKVLPLLTNQKNE